MQYACVFIYTLMYTHILCKQNVFRMRLIAINRLTALVILVNLKTKYKCCLQPSCCFLVFDFISVLKM